MNLNLVSLALQLYYQPTNTKLIHFLDVMYSRKPAYFDEKCFCLIVIFVNFWVRN